MIISAFDVALVSYRNDMQRDSCESNKTASRINARLDSNSCMPSAHILLTTLIVECAIFSQSTREITASSKAVCEPW